jgi:glutathione synthase/RimK-type ligase-like ATP-grasp enzyme
MPGPKIALFANKDSPQLLLLRDLVLEEGGEPLVFDIGLGGKSESSVALDGDRLSWDQTDLADVEIVHVRCLVFHTPLATPGVMDAASYAELRLKYLRDQEYRAFTYSFFERLAARGKIVINLPTGAYLDHDAKAQLYQKLRAQGVSTPRTIMTNDPERALSFMQEVGEVVVKPAIGVGATRKISEADLARLDELSACPVLIQEFCVGDTYRVHVVGDTVVLTLRVLFEGLVDSRTATTGVEYVKLPEEEERKLVAANRSLGLHYAAWDILAMPDGRYIYLDCNPGPFILWIGEEYARAVLLQLAKYMLGYARTRSISEAASQVQAWQPRG